MDKLFYPTLYQAGDYLSTLGLELNHVSKIGPWRYSVMPQYVMAWEQVGDEGSGIHQRAISPPVSKISVCVMCLNINARGLVPKDPLKMGFL